MFLLLNFSFFASHLRPLLEDVDNFHCQVSGSSMLARLCHVCFHRGIGSRTLVVLLVFNFSTSNVNSRQVENHPVVWKYDLSFSVVYFQRLNSGQNNEIQRGFW